MKRIGIKICKTTSRESPQCTAIEGKVYLAAGEEKRGQSSLRADSRRQG